MTVWKFNLVEAPADGQVIWIRNGWQSPAVLATYDAGALVFVLDDGRQLPWQFVWRWRPS
jgi:hypothetical protein